jgi:hypothetical protein
MLSDKEGIVLEDSDDDMKESAIESIIKKALEQRVVDSEKPRVRFTDFTTADMVVRVMPHGPSLFLNTFIIYAYPAFAAFQNDAGYSEITAPDPEKCAFVIECLYLFSSNECIDKMEESTSHDYVEFFIKRKFGGVLRNASYFMMDDLLSRCFIMYVYKRIFNIFCRFPEIWKSFVTHHHFNHEFLSTENLEGILQACDALSALERLRIILVWAKGLTLSYESFPSTSTRTMIRPRA